MGKASWGRKGTEFLHDGMNGRHYGQLKELISDRDGLGWRQDNEHVYSP